MSAPATNEGFLASPPVRITQRTLSSASSSANAAPISVRVASFSAFNTSGRATLTTAQDSSRATLMFS